MVHAGSSTVLNTASHQQQAASTPSQRLLRPRCGPHHAPSGKPRPGPHRRGGAPLIHPSRRHLSPYPTSCYRLLTNTASITVDSDRINTGISHSRQRHIRPDRHRTGTTIDLQMRTSKPTGRALFLQIDVISRQRNVRYPTRLQLEIHRRGNFKTRINLSVRINLDPSLRTRISLGISTNLGCTIRQAHLHARTGLHATFNTSFCRRRHTHRR